MTDDENNYLMPKSGGGAHLLCGTIGKHSIIGESIDEEPANEALFGTLVNPIGNGGVIRNGYVNGVPGDAGGLDNDGKPNDTFFIKNYNIVLSLLFLRKFYFWVN